MAHTNETANYDLSQFIGTDIPNPLTDYNGDMLKIDTALAGIATSATAYEARVTALETQNGSVTLETTAQTLSGAVNEVNDDVADLTSRMTVAEGKITADESTLATAVTNISTLASKVSAVETQNGNEVLTTTASTLSGGINELDAEIGGETLETTAQTVTGAINELAEGREWKVGFNLAILSTTAQTFTIPTTAKEILITVGRNNQIYNSAVYPYSLVTDGTYIIDAGVYNSAYAGLILARVSISGETASISTPGGDDIQGSVYYR